MKSVASEMRKIQSLKKKKKAATIFKAIGSDSNNAILCYPQIWYQYLGKHV